MVFCASEISLRVIETSLWTRPVNISPRASVMLSTTVV